MTTYPSPVLAVAILQAQLELGTWATSGRPVSPAAGWMGWNTTVPGLDVYTGSAWVTFTAANAFPGTTDLSVTATGTNQGTAYPITAAVTVITGGGAATGVVLPATVGLSGRIVNTTATNKVIYANGGGTVNGASSIILPAGSTSLWVINATGVAFA